MRIAIIGAGNVGGGLGSAFRAGGQDLVFALRDVSSQKPRAALESAPRATAAQPGEAVRDVDVVAFALRWDAVPETVAGMGSLEGRIVIDAMNRFSDPLRSTTQDLADLLPGAKLAKAFNTIGFENLTTARDRAVPAA